MATYVIYSYQFKTIDSYQLTFDHPDFKLPDPKKSFERKQGLLEEILSDPEFSFNKDKNDDTYVHQIVRQQDHMWLIHIGKKHMKKRHNRKLRQEQFEDFPNCFFMIDNRHNIQRIAIEKKRDAFGKTLQLAKLLQDIFNDKLKYHGLTVEILAKYYSRSFWKHIEEFAPGFTKVTFTFNIPNNPELTELVEKFIPMEAEVFNATPVHTMIAKDGGVVTIAHNDFTDPIVNYCSGGGLPIELTPKGSKRKVKCFVNEKTEEKYAVEEEFDERITAALVNETVAPSIHDHNWEEVVMFLNHLKLFYTDDQENK